MAEAVLIPPGKGEIVGDSADRRVEILSDDETLNATWSRWGPHRVGADLHVHRHHSDLFYVLEGELTVRLGVEDEPVVVPAGTLARVPPLVVHGFRNGSDAEVRYLNFHAPGQGFADYMRAIRDGRALTYDQEEPPADGGRPHTEAVVGGATPLGDGVTRLADTEAIAVSEVRTGPDLSPPAPGAHDGPTSLYVLEGELDLTAGDRRLRAAAGSWVQLPPGVRCAVSSSAPARVLRVRTPGGGAGQPASRASSSSSRS